mmetsp:Transcript_26572/g.39141  ORF Transcript_26572/g.39141 Transcript_26572/m.39141 type:complete len:253 (+) Transcript_26572:3-761(+)
MDEQILKLPKDTFDGGCTASLIFRYTPPLQQRQHHHHDNNKVYIANAGDSQTLVAAYVPSTKTVFLLYQSRMDKPHLPTEKSRIEKSGGSVYIPQDNGPGYLNETSRVWASKADGQMYGLAMSRSLGDGDSKLAGVIADPIVDVLDLNKMKKEVRKKIASGGDDHGKKEQVELFAVVASDGIYDRIEPYEVVRHLSQSLYLSDDSNNGGDDKTDSTTLLEACEQLIMKSSELWVNWTSISYRDDISIAVSKL